MRRIWQAKYSGDLRNLKIIRDEVGDILRGEGFSDKFIMDVKIILNEAITNIIKHATGGDLDEFNIDIFKKNNGIEIYFKYMDKDFNYDKIKKAVESFEIKEGGLGLILMHKLSDEVEYKREGDFVILRVVKNE